MTFAARNRSYEKKINKKMYRAAMRSIFSELLRQGRLVVSDELLLSEPKTKVFLNEAAKLDFVDGMIITSNLDINLFLSARNVPNVIVREARSINPVDLVHSSKVIVTRKAITQIEEGLS